MSRNVSSDPIDLNASANGVQQNGAPPQLTSFHRRELTLILAVYGRMLGTGMARDYAIDHMRDCAVFSIFRRTSEAPLFRIEKRPKDANRQGAWTVVSPVGGTLKRGRDLAQVLKVFDKKLIRAVD
ncbi:MAG: DUF2794 domain-containing protein [Pseudomonadota bacterium]